MSKITIRIRAINQLTGEVVMDNNPGIEVPDFKYSVMKANAEAYADMMTYCQITMSASNGSFVSIPSRQMTKDEETMSSEDFANKWYPF